MLSFAIIGAVGLILLVVSVAFDRISGTQASS